MRIGRRLPNPRTALLGLGAILVLSAILPPSPAGADDLHERLSQAKHLVRTGRMPDALVLYRQLLEDYPDQTAVAQGYGGLLRGMGRYEDALAVYDGADARSGRPRFLLDRVAILILLGRRETALTLCLDNLDAAQTIQVYLQDRILELVEEPSLRERAVRALSAAFDRDPSEVRGSTLAEIYLLEGEFEQAAEVTATLDRVTGANGERLYRFSRRLEALGERERALELISSAIESMPATETRHEAELFRAGLLVDMGRAEEAYETLTRLAAASRGHGQLYETQMQRARLLAETLGRSSDAVAIYDSLLADGRLKGKHQTVRLEKAEAQLALGRFEGALREFQTLAETGRTATLRERSRFLVGELFFFMGELDSAAAAYGVMVDLFPEGDFANDGLDRIFLFNENYEGNGEGLKDYGRLVRIEMQADHWRVLAMGDSLEIRYGRSAIDDDLLLKLASLAAHGGQVTRAIGYADTLCARYPESRLASRAMRLKGQLLEEVVGDLNAALSTYEDLLIRYPETIEAAEVRPRVTRLRRELRS